MATRMLDLNFKHLCCKKVLVNIYINCKDSIRDDPKMILGSYVKRAQRISFVERGFERLGFGHRTRVSRLVRTELDRVHSRSLSP